MGSWPRFLNPLLKACKHKIPITQIHAFILVNGLLTSESLNARLVLQYVSIGDLSSARQVFDVLPHRGVATWNAMAIALSRGGCANEVLSLFDQMVMDGVRPDSSSFTLAIKACVELSDFEKIKEIRCKVEGFGYENDLFVVSCLIKFYANFGLMDEAVLLFERMPRRDIVCWTTMITGFAQNGHPVEALDMYRRMQEEGIAGDGVVMLGLLQACACLGELNLGRSVHGYMIRRVIHMDVVIQNGLVNLYAKHGNLEVASRVFANMYHKNVVSWNAMMSGFAQNGYASSALELLVEMQNVGLKPDQASLVSALSSCSQDGLVKLGKSIHGYIIRRLECNQVLGTAMIDFYAKCALLSAARTLFDLINYRDPISWSAMISSYGIHGHGKEALALFLQMIETNQKPDRATFSSLLSALSHSGLVEEGQHWFNIMIEKYKIQPGEKHYICMVDLLARAGLVEEAQDLIESMNLTPGLAVWVALLSGCYSHKKLSIGEVAAKNILDQNPDDLGAYTLVSNFFALARKWDGVSYVRKIMKTAKMRKIPGYSIVDTNGTLQAFLMEDKSHNEYGSILHILDLLDNEIRAVRNVPKLQFCVTGSLRKHCWKL